LTITDKKGFVINYIRAVLTIWWALRTPQRRGPTGKLDTEEEEGWEECPSPQPLRS